jgi:cytoskeletal protein CcmA (bactofilin family)
MIFKANNGAGGDLNGFVDRGSQLHGELRFEHSFRVDGKVAGKITSSGELVVGDSGEIDAEIEVGRIFVNGTVRGSVLAIKQVHIAPGGKVFARLQTPSLVIEDGAHFEGHCSMPLPGDRRSSQPPPAAAATSEAQAQQQPLPVEPRRAGGPQLVASRKPDR